jgi:hypothetical protein
MKTMLLPLMLILFCCSVFAASEISVPEIHNEIVYQEINIPIEINDEYLYRWRVYIDDKLIKEETSVDYDKINYNIKIDPSKLEAGKHDITVEKSSSKPASQKSKYKINKGGWFNDKDLKFTSDDTIILIRPEHEDTKDRFDTTEYDNKYSFSYKPNHQREHISFIVQSNKPITLIREDTEWLVIDDQWLDFVSDDIVQSTVRYYFYDENNVLVEMKRKPGIETVQFHSVGDINTTNETFSVYTINSTATFYDTVPENYPNTIALFLDYQGTGIDYQNITVVLNYDGDEYTPTRTANSNYALYEQTLLSPNVTLMSNTTFYWTVTVVDTDYNLTYNQTVRPVEVAICDGTYSVEVSEDCVQEEPDVQEACGGGDGGGYEYADLTNASALIDGDWDTSTNISEDVFNMTYNVTYDLDSNIDFNDSVWKTKDSYNGVINHSITGCPVVSNQVYLQIFATRSNGTEQGQISYSCLNASGSPTILLQNSSLGTDFEPDLYEEHFIQQIVDNTTHTQALHIDLKDETYFTPWDGTVNINIDVLDDAGNEVIKRYGFGLENDNEYDICIYPNNTFYQTNIKLEYFSDIYANRKYFLNNYTLSNDNTNLSLYSIIREDEASDVSLIVYDQSTGQRIADAYIKILRYYPNLDSDSSSSYRTIEIEKTDENGQTLAKLILADIWYKFIVEYPAGTVLFTSDVQKILSTEKLLPISTAQNTYADYFADLGVYVDVDCSITDMNCVCEWNTNDGSELTAELRIYQDTGFSKQLINSEQTTSSAGSLIYEFTNITNKRYVAECWKIE